MIKRIFDILASSMGILLLSPLMLAIGVAIRLDSPGPVLFRQERVGRHGRIFRIFKFRTMVNGAHRHGRSITVGGDVRVTGVGRLLRRFKLDEFPQLLNVVRGEMSLVGPRPEVPRYVTMFPEAYAPILRKRPGITHQAAILFRDEEDVLAQTADPELYYVEVIMPRKLSIYAAEMGRENFWTDLLTILETVLAVVRDRVPSLEPMPHRGRIVGHVPPRPLPLPTDIEPAPEYLATGTGSALHSSAEG